MDFISEMRKELSGVTKLSSTEVLLKELESSYIDPKEEYSKPPVCVEIKGAVFATLGNISMVIGKAKSRKTFCVTIALASVVKNNTVLNHITGHLPENNNIVLFFDTEQGKYHVHKAVKRVCSLSGIDYPENFRAYGLRKYTPTERLNLIEAKLYNTPNLGFVVIDGIKDLVTSINDEAEASMITSRLMKWSEELNIHIMVVLHQNKGDVNARGHIGTEIQNKAESVISVTKASDNKDISIVEAEYVREKDFDSFAFSIDDNGLPYILEEWTQMKAETLRQKKALPPFEITDITHKGILKIVYNTEKEPKLSEFKASLKNALEYHYNGNDSSNNASPIKITGPTVEQYLAHYLNNGFIEKRGNTPQTRYVEIEKTGN